MASLCEGSNEPPGKRDLSNKQRTRKERPFKKTATQFLKDATSTARFLNIGELMKRYYTEDSPLITRYSPFDYENPKKNQQVNEPTRDSKTRPNAKGLSGEYLEEENTELRSQFHSLVALAFVPENDVIHASIFSKKTPFFHYFEDNYVMGRRRGRNRQQPMYPPNTRNCYIRTWENLPRTTNICEAWLRHLNTLMDKAHPSFYHVLQLLQEETARIHQDIEKLEAGLNLINDTKKAPLMRQLDQEIIGRVVSSISLRRPG
ncbi:hypothetical protein ANN_15743 [Periplaneta americana]|uniref:Uncharacterized protein n=1 Tax=Periplaneta americana TaxID=6978 RepID=A0ABQ8SHY5_PERAM|nr:hypothetical protein ANN_15743 [Periplaneta americana]